MTAISNGWSILVQSWAVLKKDRELIVFPIISGIACLLVAASFVTPFLAVPEWRQAAMQALDEEQPGGGPLMTHVLMYALMFLYYFVNYFIITFCNTALVSCAIIRFKGGDPTVSDGVNAALARLPQILGWSLLAATVGLILRAIEERSGVIGGIVSGILGLLWTVTTYLVVPVLVVEKVGPVEAVKRSVVLLKKCWGEGLVGNFGLGIVNLLFVLPALLILLVGGGAVAAVGHWWPMVLAGVGVALYLVALGIVMSTLQQIFLAGLYLYAAEGRVPDGFSEDVMRNAFRRKNK